MNVFRRELKASRKSLIFWMIGIIAMVGGSMGKYSGVTESGDSMNALMADLPKSLQAAFGVSDLDLSTPIGYYGVLFLYLLLMAAIHASMLGANIVSKEERDKTSEFLLVKPISRSRLLVWKVCAAAVNVLVFNASMFICSALFMGEYAAGQAVAGDLWALALGMLPVQFVFMSIGLAIAGTARKPKRAVALSAAIMLLTYVLSMVIEVSGRLDYLRILSPFQYADASSIIAGGIEGGFVLLSILIVAVCLAIMFAGYRRRDIQA